MIDLHEKRGLVRSRIAIGRNGVAEVQAVGRFLREGDAQHTPREPQHEIDRFRRDIFGRRDQVPLVFAVERVDHDHLAAPPQTGQRLLDSS